MKRVRSLLAYPSFTMQTWRRRRSRVRSYRLHQGVRYRFWYDTARRSLAAVVAALLITVASVPVVQAMRDDSDRQAGGQHQSERARRSSSAIGHGRSESKPTSTPTPATAPTISSGLAAPSATPPISNTTASAWTALPLYVEPGNGAAVQAASGSATDIIRRSAALPVAKWFGNWNVDPAAATDQYVSAAAQAGAAPVLVLYNIPFRDCGSFSAGGADSFGAYLAWIRAAAQGIGNRTAVVILEPDAVAQFDCLSTTARTGRAAAISQAVDILKANTGTAVYIDAGNPAWHQPAAMAERLRQTNIGRADGFSLNVANYTSTGRNQTYGDQLARLLGGKRFVVDVSRNGNPNLKPGEWCNNHAAALGVTPTTRTGSTFNDGLLWIKIPWESDGTCNGGPTAGSPFWSFYLQMARNAGW